ncbi:hypothetical protein GLOIN_2v1777370 [Rhizophagus irregularis DAOM 181602=DAOM 197198]|nr:hypothetical protein GLOIN_2v1777370 [Rhizophagus irregularis DAOM 181602=DAOM 197198]
MSTIVTKYVAEHKLNKNMSNEELSQHVLALLKLLTDKLKRDKGRQRFQKGEKEVKAIAKALTITSLNPIATTSRLRIDFSDYFSLESVKKRLNFYDVSNTSDVQALADIIIMLCIRPTEIKDLRISNGSVTEYTKN